MGGRGVGVRRGVREEGRLVGRGPRPWERVAELSLG